MKRLVGSALACLTTVTMLATGTGSAAASPSSPLPLVPSPLRLVHSVPATTNVPSPATPVSQLILRTTNGRRASSTITSSARTYSGGVAVTAVRVLPSGMTVIRFAHPLSASMAHHVSALLTARSDVAWAQPDHHFVALGSSPVPDSDPYFDSQWDLWDSTYGSPNGGYSMRAPAAWQHERGRHDIVVAVLDTGITPHPELANAVIDTGRRDRGYVVPYGYDFISDPVIANDNDPAATGNSRDANPLDDGDFVTADDVTNYSSTYGCTRPDPSSWHGTHVAGTIAAAQDTTGITGIAPGVTIEPVRVLGKCGGSESDIIDAIEWASGHHVDGVPDNTDHKATVINMSLGGPGICSAGLQTAINDAVAAGTSVVVAAGNDSTDITAINDTTGSSPGDCSGVIAVSATGRSGELAQYSNYGTVAGAVTIAAPGGDDFSISGTDNILSTWWNSPDTLTNGTNGGADYAYMAGTSMATPHVAAVVALMQSHLTTPLTPSQVAQRLRETATPFPASSGCTVIHCGAGILNAGAAIATVPSAADYINATPLPASQIRLTWSRPNWGGSPILNYLVDQSTDGGHTWQPATTSNRSVQGLDLITTVSGLTTSTAYRFRVTAVNQLSANPSGYQWATMTRDVVAQASPVIPDQVAQPTVRGGVENFTVSWVPPSGVTPTGYTISFHRRGTSSPWTTITPNLPASARSYTYSPWPVAAFTPGTYDVRVAAIRGSATGPASLSKAGSVTALLQTGSASASILRPAKDGFQDSVILRATSNAPRSGTVRIRNSAGAVVMSWPLGTSTGWSAVWSGRDSSGTRVPFGTYRVEFWRPVRSSTPALISTRTLSVLSSQAAIPTVHLVSDTVYPAKDGYYDTIPIRASAVVPATFSLDVLNKGVVVYHRTYSRRSLLTVPWNGTDDRIKVLPVGSYTLRITAHGLEGKPTIKLRKVEVSALRAYPHPFSLQVSAGMAMQAYSPGVTVIDAGNGVHIDGGDDPSTKEMEVNLATFNEKLPASVLTPTSVIISACTTHTDNTAAGLAYLGYFSGALDNPYLSRAWSYSVGDPAGCYRTKASAPSFALGDGYVQWWVGNGNIPGKTWTVNSFRITGVSYVLGP